MNRESRLVRIVALALMFIGGHAAAQSYPNGPMRMIVPFPPGGGTDILARALAQKLNEAWGVPVVVENRGGANGTIGAAVAAKAQPDGHTMLVVPSGFAVNPSIYKKNLPFDSLRDLAPVTELAASPLILVVHPSFPPKSVKQLIAFLRANPDTNYGSSGNGSPPHIAAELFKYMTGTRMTHIPYKGAGPATVDLIAGQIPIYFINALSGAPYIKAGRLRALGATTDKRFAAFPDIPTIAEAGVPGYSMSNWYGMLVTGGSPRPAINKLHAEVVRILKLPEIRERLSGEGAEIVGSTPEQFTAFLKNEMAKNAKIVAASGMTASN